MKTKKYNKIILLILFFVFYAVITNAQIKPLKGFIIDGSIYGVKDSTLVKLIEISEQKVIDSAIILKGQFLLKGHVDTPTSCWITCLNDYAIIEVENVKMTFKSPLKNMYLNSITTGGPAQTLQNKLNELQRPSDRLASNLRDRLENKKYKDDDEKENLLKKYKAAQQSSMETYIDFGKHHINSLLGMDIVYRNRDAISKDTIASLYAKISNPLKKTTLAEGLRTFLSEPIAEKGKKLVDFHAKTINGQDFKLSDLKGKYIYLSFGSAGCGACRMENAEIRKHYSDLSDQISFVYFSMDKNPDSWQAAHKFDKDIWFNVSDLKGDYGKIKTQYGVQAMPTSFLISPNGVIIEKIEGYDPSMISNLKKLITTDSNNDF